MENNDTKYVNRKYTDLDHGLTKVSFNITNRLKNHNKEIGFHVSTE